jgi:hypothetical protein
VMLLPHSAPRMVQPISIPAQPRTIGSERGYLAATIRVEKSRLYPDMDANALRRLRHRGSVHGSDGSDKEDCDDSEEDGDYEEKDEESDEEEDGKDFEDDAMDGEEEMPDLVGSEEGDDDRDYGITIYAIDAFVLKILLFFNPISMYDRTSGTSARRVSCSTS